MNDFVFNMIIFFLGLILRTSFEFERYIKRYILRRK